MLSLIGLCIAISAIIGAQILDDAPLALLFNIPALSIVLGGTIGAVIIQTPMASLKKSLKQFFWVLYPPKHHQKAITDDFMHWSRVVRQHGIIALEKHTSSHPNLFIRKGLDLLMTGHNAEIVRSILELEVNSFEQDENNAVKVFESMGGYAPTIGIIGAVLGLIHVMSNLTDPSNLGAGIAVAFVATIYGVGIANLFFLPIANKLYQIVDQEVRYKEMIIEGFVALSKGEHPKLIEAKLNTFY